MSNNYPIIRIQQYLNGELSEAEMYQLEREALDDPLLQDAIDGYRMQQGVSHRRLSLLQQRLADRIAGQAKERNAFFFGWQRLGIAATACVLMVLVLVLLWMRNQSIQPQATEKEVAVELTPLKQAHATAVGGAGFDAIPKNGWEQFNAYLANNKKELAMSGKVTLQFAIDRYGKPTAILVEDKGSEQLVAEARRLLEQGPVWQGAKGKVMFSFE